MIRLFDAATLAHTKFRTRKIRSAITVTVAGVLFGLLLFVVITSQGIINSVASFSHQGLNDRYVFMISRFNIDSYNAYDHLDDQAFIQKVQDEYDAIVAKKQAAAKKYQVPYDPKVDDPSPITVDPLTKQKTIDVRSASYESVRIAADKITQAEHTSLDIKSYLAPYPSAKVLAPLSTSFGSRTDMLLMKDGKELMALPSQQRELSEAQSQTPWLQPLEKSLADPFVTSTTFDPAKGELPVIMPYSDAEKLLGFKPLDGSATNQMKLDRLQEVQRRVGEVTAAFCYRNSASQSLLSQALSQQEEARVNKNNPSYKKPHLQYGVPDNTSCGAVTVASDTRTAAEKRADENRTKFEKEVGTYIGDPEQQKITVRAVGLSADLPDGATASSLEGVMRGLFSSSLGYQTWSMPADLLERVPASARPAALFEPQTNMSGSLRNITTDGYYVEFGDKEEARAMLKKSGFFDSQGGVGKIGAVPFGSSSLVLDELLARFRDVLLWGIGVVSLVAVIILGGMIGRTIADGRRESAVFRAIGAKRIDIMQIYSIYTFMLSLRVAVFALVLGLAVAFVLDILYSHEATIGALLAFNSSNMDLAFHFVGYNTWYVPLLLGTIIVIGFVAMIIPILRNIRRSPIKDMRDES